MFDEALEKAIDLVFRLWLMKPEGSSSHVYILFKLSMYGHIKHLNHSEPQILINSVLIVQ
jgi:hypothetical protein